MYSVTRALSIFLPIFWVKCMNAFCRKHLWKWSVYFFSFCVFFDVLNWCIGSALIFSWVKIQLVTFHIIMNMSKININIGAIVNMTNWWAHDRSLWWRIRYWYELQNLRGKWLQLQFGFANYLILIMCLISYDWFSSGSIGKVITYLTTYLVSYCLCVLTV